MSIKISKGLIEKLPELEKANIKDILWQKSGGICFLCADEINEAGEDLVPDHDIPEAEEGETNAGNLNLVHSSCNSFKRNHPTVDVRPFLKLTRLIKKKGGFLKYDQAASLLGIIPKPIEIQIEKNLAQFKFSDNSTQKCSIYQEENKEGKFLFCYVEVPSNAIFNDDECQPRAIKEQHLWQIYNDINRNPLHEAPACRLIKIENSINLYKALMFDGQHKTLAFWVAGRSKICVKIYLEFERESAIRLVNSIQSKIKKLPLSPFELAAKMSEEWQDRLSKYEAEVEPENASEEGFILWVEKDERNRAKSAFIDALYQSIIDDDRLEFKKIVLKPSQKGNNLGLITEATFKNKVLKPLLHTNPIKDNFTKSQVFRNREASYIITILNILFRELIKPDNGADLSPQDEIRIKKLLYQSSLNYIMSLIRTTFMMEYKVEAGEEFFLHNLDENKIDFLETVIKRIIDHPVWISKVDSKKMKAVHDALSKNQNAEKAFKDVFLRTGYASGRDHVEMDMLKDN